MENKIYLEEFLDKLSKMLEKSTNDEQIYTCIKYIENYKVQLSEVIENDLFRESTINFLNELINTVEDEIKK
jgi:hypothetical protein